MNNKDISFYILCARAREGGDSPQLLTELHSILTWFADVTFVAVHSVHCACPLCAGRFGAGGGVRLPDGKIYMGANG